MGVSRMCSLSLLSILCLLLPTSAAPGGSSLGGVYEMRRAGADSEFTFTFGDSGDSSCGFDIGSLGSITGSLGSIPQYGDYTGGVEHDRVVGFTDYGGDYGGEVGNIEY